MVLVRVHRQQREPRIVRLRDGAAERVLVHVAHLEVLEAASRQWRHRSTITRRHADRPFAETGTPRRLRWDVTRLLRARALRFGLKQTARLDAKGQMFYRQGIRVIASRKNTAARARATGSKRPAVRGSR